MNSNTNATRATVCDEATTIRRDQWTGYDNPSTAVVEAVAEATGRTQTELEPLQHYVDADALDALCTTSGTERLELTLRYESTEIHVTNRGDLEVRLLETDD
jgi:hypothetical protein